MWAWVKVMEHTGHPKRELWDEGLKILKLPQIQLESNSNTIQVDVVNVSVWETGLHVWVTKHQSSFNIGRPFFLGGLLGLIGSLVMGVFGWGNVLFLGGTVLLGL